MLDVYRSDAHSAFVSYRYAPNEEAARTMLSQICDQWEHAAWPEGLLSFGSYLSTDNDAVLTYAQAASGDCYRPFVRTLSGPAQAEPVEYRLLRSVRAGARTAPGCMIIAMFDVDGPDRQTAIIDSLEQTLERSPWPTGMLSANFHASVDGTRVLNYAEWVSDEAHIAFLAGATRQATLRTSHSLPGVRPIGFRRYHLHRTLTR
ncbi:hypothetical protein [Nocardia sp. NPDC004860]|uniref:hypothetical protein n=1 Tax=Nocardia sp. NPDC004860 TaxID=3154557 RepID=UPI0033B77BA1